MKKVVLFAALSVLTYPDLIYVRRDGDNSGGTFLNVRAAEVFCGNSGCFVAGLKIGEYAVFQPTASLQRRLSDVLRSLSCDPGKPVS